MALLLQAFHGAAMLADARNSHEEFCIPVCVLPATVSNSVPGTEVSIGTDTGLNVVVQVRDCFHSHFALFVLMMFFFCLSAPALNLWPLTFACLALIRS